MKYRTSQNYMNITAVEKFLIGNTLRREKDITINKNMPRVRIELTTLRLWDLRAAYCATEASVKQFLVVHTFLFQVSCFFNYDWGSLLYDIYLKFHEMCVNIFHLR